MVTAQQAEDVTARCVAAEPHRGATWQAIAKNDANRGNLYEGASRARRSRVAKSVP